LKVRASTRTHVLRIHKGLTPAWLAQFETDPQQESR
jgi:hypothetical protein